MPSLYGGKAGRICQRWQSLEATLSIWKPYWQDLGNYLLPRKSHITEWYGSPSTDQIDRLYDTSASYALRVNANGCMSYISPHHERWSVYVPPRALEWSDRARKWYAQCTEIVSEELQRSNF